MALTYSWPGPTGLTTTTDARKNLAALVETNSAGVVRSGVFPSHANPLVTARADMNVDVQQFNGVTVQFGGPVLLANDGVAQLPSVLVSPASGNNFYVVYAKQNESVSPGTDANNNRLFGVTLSTSSFAAARALLPAGALELATVQVPSAKTATNQSGVVITPTFLYTAAEGGVVWARNATELAAWTPADGALAYQIDTSQSFQRQGGAWLPLLRGKTSFTPSWVNFLVGPSAVSAWWQTVGNVCEGRAKVTLASGYSLSSSGIEMNPPIPAANPSDGAPIGQATYIDAGVAYYNGALMQGASGTLRLMHFGGSSAAAATSGTAPFGFGVSDSIQLAWRYEV